MFLKEPVPTDSSLIMGRLNSNLFCWSQKKKQGN